MALTNEDLQAIATLVNNAVTSAKDEILESVHTSKMELYKEIVICEKDIESIKDQMSKVNVLYLKEDTTKTLMENIQQLELRISELEKKIS